jgi:hypothetical protein
VTYEFMPPPPDGAELIHSRRYEVRTYKLSDDRFLLRGVLCDEKPGGLYLQEDPDPLWVHHMVVDLEVSYPAFRIESVSVEMKEHPHTRCTNILPKYDGLVGLSIARGFNNKIREMFGGPRGCTHIGALLSAMAPVAIQSGWSMRAGAANGKKRSEMSAEERARGHEMNLNTCHMWDENGDMVNEIRRGEPMEVPVWMRKRLVKLGKNPDEWTGWD